MPRCALALWGSPRDFCGFLDPILRSQTATGDHLDTAQMLGITSLSDCATLPPPYVLFHNGARHRQRGEAPHHLCASAASSEVARRERAHERARRP